MFKAFMRFNKGILAMPIPWQAWMVLLVTVNMVLPIFFLGKPEAVVVLVAVMISMFTMVTLFAKF